MEARFRALVPGEPAPAVVQRSFDGSPFTVDLVAGRYIVMVFHGDFTKPAAQSAYDALLASPHFDDERACLFAVSIAPEEERSGLLKPRIPGLRVLWDHDLAVSRAFGSVPPEGDARTGIPVRRKIVVIDPTYRLLREFPLEHVEDCLTWLDGLPPPACFAGFEVFAPVLVLPNVFERDLCTTLIDRFEAAGGETSGFMTEIGGRTVGVHDPNHKVRRDYYVEDEATKLLLQRRLARRVVPEIHKVHHFNATRMERYLVGCYGADEGGHFRAHRDNTTKGTAHRRFAVSINLNADFEGGCVSFPEYGPREYKAPVGGAVVFSCSLLHRVSRVTRGKRYAFLPFLYDEEAARVREANVASLEGGSYTA